MTSRFSRGGLGHDSLDVAEIITALKREYGISEDTIENVHEIIETFTTLSDFIQANSTKT